MTTLESIVESLKLQLKPHLNDDVKLYDEFIIRMIHDTRSALIRSLYVSNSALTQFYQDVSISEIEHKPETGTYRHSIVTLPTQLMTGCGRKNIQNVWSDGDEYDMTYHYCSYEEFMTYRHHVYGSMVNRYCNKGDDLLVYDENKPSSISVRGIFEYPDEVSGYSYTDSVYPIGANNLRQLEIVTFQHLASKLGMPVDIINNGYDETKNAPVHQQQQERRNKEENQE